MRGKMIYKVKNVHGTKPTDVVLPDGTTIKTITCIEDAKGEKVWVRVIDL